MKPDNSRCGYVRRSGLGGSGAGGSGGDGGTGAGGDGGSGAGGTGGNGGGNGNGDTHLLSLDHSLYDFQGAGEFILTSDGNLFEVQVRQQAWNSCTSVNTAVAMRVESHRVAFYTRRLFTVYLDGTAIVPLCEGTSRFQSIDAVANGLPSCSYNIGNGSAVSYDGSLYTVTWPNAEHAVDVTPMGGYLNVRIRDFHLSKMQGLLGDSNGNPADDLPLPNGDVLPIPPNFEDMYSTFADAWRVTPGTSLFDYEGGESTQGFTDRSFPPDVCYSDVLSSAVRSSAELTCVAAGVTDTNLLDACALDVVVLGPDSAQSYSYMPSPQLAFRALAKTTNIGTTATNEFLESAGGCNIGTRSRRGLVSLVWLGTGATLLIVRRRRRREVSSNRQVGRWPDLGLGVCLAQLLHQTQVL